MPVNKISLKTTDGKTITLRGNDVTTQEVVEALEFPDEDDVKGERALFAARMSQRHGIPIGKAAKLRQEVDDVIEAVFAMSGGFCLDEPDERAALADVLAVEICDALPELATLLRKGA